ncbi:hypothetical protein ILUMI_16522, partial [Ignelater luminosus]
MKILRVLIMFDFASTSSSKRNHLVNNPEHGSFTSPVVLQELSTGNEQITKKVSVCEKFFPPIPVGSFVVIAVPEVDRDKIDAKNILVIEIIMDVTDDEYYKVGCKSGITDSLYSRNQMSMCKENFVSQETFNIP